VVKIFISARANEAPLAFRRTANAIPKQGQEASRSIAIVNVPRAQSSISAALLSKHKRLARIPDQYPGDEPPVPKADIAALLESSEYDLISDPEKDNEKFSTMVESPSSITSPSAKSNAKTLDYSDLSDSSMEFTRFDPFPTSEESDLDQIDEKKQSTEDDDDSEEDELFPSARAHHH
jgi:hypothetical protein